MDIKELLVGDVNRDRRHGPPAFSGIDRPNANATARCRPDAERRDLWGDNPYLQRSRDGSGHLRGAKRRLAVT